MRRVTVIPRVRFRGWDGTEPCETPLADVIPLRDVLEAEYRSDACIVGYAPPDPEIARFPRLTKASLGYFAVEPDDMPHLTTALVDVDYENHEVPPEGWAEDIVARSPWPEVGWYRTPHGLRLIYVPREPVPVDRADSYISQLHDELRAAGVPSDAGTEDWTRLFIAPKAMGRDFEYDYSRLAPLDWHPDTLHRADPGSVGPIVSRDMQTAVDTVPDKITRSDLKPLGRGSRLAESIYRGRLSAPVGKRHATLLSAARKIVSSYDTEDPMVPFHLLHDSATSMGKPTDELWRICEWVCAHQSGVKIEREEAHDAAVEDMSETTGASRVDAMNRLIIDAGKEQFVWDEDRLEYSTGYTHSHQLLGALQRHCPTLADGYYEGDMSREEIMRDLSTVADSVVYTYSDEFEGYDKTTYTFYRRVCRQDREIRPRYNAAIARWLEALFADDIDHGLDWLASVPLIDRPTCAMYVHGPPSIGKGMLAMGIARLWSKEATVTPYSELIGTFNPTLKRSPLILADERVPQDMFQANDSSVFRRIIGNGAMRVRDLHRSPATLSGYPRVLITANNEDALHIREELGPEDLDAIRLRVGYIRTDDEAANVLSEIAQDAGFDSTRAATESWVSGGGIAEHMLWLSENRDYTPGDRLLVEGWDSALTRSLSTAAGSTGAIAEVIALLIAEQPECETEGVRWFGGHVYVNNPELGRIWSSIVRNDFERPPKSTSRLKALKALSQEQKRRLDVYDGRGNRSQRSYWMIDGDVIARLAAERNICPEEVILDRVSREEEPNEDRYVLDLSTTKTEEEE